MHLIRQGETPLSSPDPKHYPPLSLTLPSVAYPAIDLTG